MEEARRVEVVAELDEGQDDAASTGAVAEKVLEWRDLGLRLRPSLEGEGLWRDHSIDENTETGG